MKIRAKKAPIKAKRGPIRAKTKPAKVYAKPVNRYGCEPWKSQTIVAAYRGESTNSFTLPPYLTKLTANEVPTAKLASATPQYKQRESELWTNIADALKRVKQVHAESSYWAPFPGSFKKVGQYVTQAENALEKIVNTYSEWRQVPYRVHLWTSNEIVSLAGVKTEIEKAGIWEVSWPLNERLTDRDWIRKQAQGLTAAGAKIEAHGDSDFAWIWDDYTSKLSKDSSLNHQIWYVEQERPANQGGKVTNFDDLYAVMGRPSWSARRNAIKLIRNELKKAADAARCAEVWTAFVVSYAQNRQLWEKQQGDHSQTAGRGTYRTRNHQLRRERQGSASKVPSASCITTADGPNLKEFSYAVMLKPKAYEGPDRFLTIACVRSGYSWNRNCPWNAESLIKVVDDDGTYWHLCRPRRRRRRRRSRR